MPRASISTEPEMPELRPCRHSGTSVAVAGERPGQEEGQTQKSWHDENREEVLTLKMVAVAVAGSR